MKLFLQSLMIFFGTLMAAGLLALSEPAGSASASAGREAPSAQAHPERDRQAGGIWRDLAVTAGSRLR